MIIRKRMQYLAVGLLTFLLTACGGQTPSTSAQSQTQSRSETDASPAAYVYPEDEKDFSSLRTPGSQEAAYDYRLFFLPEVDGTSQPYVGDPMPFYEDGVYYMYYLKEAGDSYNHSIYLATTKDFLSYTEYDDPILESSRDGGQDGWIGTGSVVKVGKKYYLFYTAHASSDTYEYGETIRVAEGDSPTAFSKKEGWELLPPAEIGQKRDFRDPQAYYDEETDTITLTVTAAQANVARILKYTLSGNLENPKYEGVILSDPTKSFWNLECSDTFKLGGKYYITYSGQDDTLWYASSDTPYGPYDEPRRLEDKLFYAAKHVGDEENVYMVGWTRRSESPSSTQEVSAWGGNLAVQQLHRNEDGSLSLSPAKNVQDAFTTKRELPLGSDGLTLAAGSAYNYQEAFTAFERFLLKGTFTYTGKGSFGLAFDFSNRPDKYKLIAICPEEGKVALSFNEGNVPVTETAVKLEAGKTYGFTYLQEGSCGVFYIDGMAALTVRLYGVSGKPVRLFAENNSVEFKELCEYTMPS